MPNRRRCAALGAAMLSTALVAGCAQDPVNASVTVAPGQGRTAALVRLGRDSMDHGAYASAAGFYRRAHDMDPSAFAPLLGLGQALARAGALEEAAEALREALKLKPGDAQAHRLLGEVLVALNRPSLAIAQFQTALKTKPEARTYNGLGVAHDMMGAYAAAEKDYRAGLSRDPADASLNTNLALSLAVNGHYDEAIRLLMPIALGPLATARQRQDLALVYGLAGEREKAAELASQDLDPASVRHNLAFYERLRELHDPAAVADALGLRQLGPASEITAR